MFRVEQIKFLSIFFLFLGDMQASLNLHQTELKKINLVNRTMHDASTEQIL